MRPWVVALALGVGALAVWWPRLLPARRVVSVDTGVVEVRSDGAIDSAVVRVAEEAARRVRHAGLEIPKRQLVLLCRTRSCWLANPAPRWARATTRLLDGLVVLSPYVPLGPAPALPPTRPAWWRLPAYWELPESRHECAVRVLTHELAHVADIRQRGRLRAWRAGAPEAEAFASRVARATARPDPALGPSECAGGDG
ncbi:MAG TPA: hypothetical protein VFS05_03355 [Gemmatimonadaceae bacterium]|nr:hypothetical protein [Gemmatimonadaceae bacterium]